ncbi:MAG: 2-C-methyl-D-erythritol 2,4-cyclodiphosphate synthase, partial [Chloroflexi bacterium]|nr:2-C-methyl-D-erythritol 2,4-cyclodiphosphate synthase [Chloroflexota bacterium]
MRVGIGYDAHPLVSGRSLVLGGVHIPFEKGLSGHSDADVLTHAIIDALLGASGLKDIGTHFPSQDSRYKDISSLKLLDEVNKLVKAKGSRVGNIDATIVAQQ